MKNKTTSIKPKLSKDQFDALNASINHMRMVINSNKRFQTSLNRSIKNGHSAYGGTQKNRIKTFNDMGIIIDQQKSTLEILLKIKNQ